MARPRNYQWQSIGYSEVFFKNELFWNAGYFFSRIWLKPVLVYAVSETCLTNITRTAKRSQLEFKDPAGSWNMSKLNSGESTVTWRACFCFSGQDETCEPVFQLSCWTVDVQEKLLPFVDWNRCVCFFQLQSAFQGFRVKMFCMWVECSAKKDK